MSVYNIINNPPKEFTEPCECCGVSEFQLGVRHAEERIIKLLEERKAEILSKQDADDLAMDLWVDGIVIRSIDYEIELIKGETK